MLGPIIAANINVPGSWHDSCIAQPIYCKLELDTPDGFYVVADTAFPRGTQSIAGRIQAPVKTGQCMQGTAEQIEAFDRELLSYRQTAEWGNRALQGSFGCLQIPLEINDSQRRGDLIETCIRLYNFRAERVGLNQIREVYMPQWRMNAEDEERWSNFENMLFSDQRKKDCVSRFHTYPEFD